MQFSMFMSDIVYSNIVLKWFSMASFGSKLHKHEKEQGILLFRHDSHVCIKRERNMGYGTTFTPDKI